MNPITNPAYQFMPGNIYHTMLHSDEGSSRQTKKEVKVDNQPSQKIEVDAFGASIVLGLVIVIGFFIFIDKDR